MFAWLKDTLPNRLYARAALILVAPVIVLQLVITVVFLQRHFEGVTLQLTRGIVLETELIQRALAENPGMTDSVLTDIAERLDMQADLSPPRLPQTLRPFYDISGLVVIATFQAELDGFRAVDLSTDPQVASLSVDSAAGPLVLTFDRERVSASNPHQLLIISILVGGLMTVVSYLFLRNQLRPIKRLSAAAEAFGKGRTLPYRPSGALEVRAAGHAFLDMRNRIERQIEQRTLMLSGVSHDLRTPLTRMKLELSMLDPSAEVDALVRDVTEMEALLEAFLDFAKNSALEAMHETDPLALARDAVLRAERAGHEVAFVMKGEASGATLPLRARSVARALDNLIGNAGRYAGRAQVSVTLDESRLTMMVEDDGPGIPADRREEAVRPFARLDRARNQDKGSGVGLGLAIVADVARSHGGMLRLDESETLGGLRASLVLPR